MILCLERPWKSGAQGRVGEENLESRAQEPRPLNSSLGIAIQLSEALRGAVEARGRGEGWKRRIRPHGRKGERAMTDKRASVTEAPQSIGAPDAVRCWLASVAQANEHQQLS
jgi:hypothetical protein